MVSVDPTQDFLCQRILNISTLSCNKQPQKQMREQRVSSQRENFDPTLYPLVSHLWFARSETYIPGLAKPKLAQTRQMAGLP